MGNKPPLAPIPEPETFSKTPVSVQPGTIVTPVAENSEAIVYSTKFRSPFAGPTTETREIQSVMSQNHGTFIVRPKNNLANGKVLQVKALNPQSEKLFYVVRKQEGADKWISGQE